MDEHALGFGKHQILGCPYHGLVVGNRLTLPNGQQINNQWNTFQVRGAYRLAVPGVAAITRTPEQAAEDAARGYIWRSDAVVWLYGNSRGVRLYGRQAVDSPCIYAPAPGQCWAISMPFMPFANAEFTALNAPATMAAFGRIGAAPDERSVTVALAGYGPGRFPPERFLTVDCSGSGNRALVTDSLFYDAAHDMYVQGPSRLALLRSAGTGTPENPLSLTLEFVADQSSVPGTFNDGFVLFDGVFEWQAAISIEWIPPKEPQSDGCQWMLRRTTGYTLAYLPKNPDIPRPSNWVRFITGVRTAAIEGYVLGGWLDANGDPVLVTCDIEYRFEAEHRMSCQRTAQTDREEVFRYTSVGGQCGLDGSWGDQQYNVAGEFNSAGSYGASTTERITYTLRAGGAEVDTYAIEYIYDQSAQLGGPVSSPPDAVTSGRASAVVTHTLKLNEVLLDQIVVTQADVTDTPVFARNLLVQPLLDVLNRFGVQPVEQWLPTAAASEHKLPEVTAADGTIRRPSVVVQMAPHWWSNNMVCLAKRQRPWQQSSIGGGARTYGPTAHPGGIEAGSITVTAPSALTPPPPRFGARSPLTGAITLGNTQRIQYV